ncbi:MAG: ABC transporter permease [Actinomycetota bacterium]
MSTTVPAAQSSATARAVPPLRDITPPKRFSPIRAGELWRARELLFFLAQRDVKVRYKQAFIGIAWAVLQPVLMMVIFAVFLGALAKVHTTGLPYAVFAFAGLIPWLFFANGVGSAADSLVTNANLISKVYFPRLVIPLASVSSWLLDMVIATLVLIAMMAVYGLAPARTVVFLPVFMVLAIISSLAVSLWLSALNVAYRDIHYAAPFFIQIALFLTPVTFPATLLPFRYRWLFALNPMSGAVEGFRWAITGAGHPPWAPAGASLAIAGIVLVLGLRYFRKVEQFFADVI